MHQSIQCKHQSTATHQPVAYASACSTHISLQPTHQSTAYASLCSLHFSLQHTHQSTAIHQSIAHTSVSSPGISLQHTNQSTAQTWMFVNSPRISLHHRHESTAYAWVYSLHSSVSGFSYFGIKIAKIPGIIYSPVPPHRHFLRGLDVPSETW